jgi:hypothetical protein
MKSTLAKPQIREYRDSKGNIIKAGDTLKTNITKYVKNEIITEVNGDLGFILKYGDTFVPLNSLIDDFFEKCEIIINSKN